MPFNKYCEHCKLPFISKKSMQRFCSLRCATLNHRPQTINKCSICKESGHNKIFHSTSQEFKKCCICQKTKSVKEFWKKNVKMSHGIVKEYASSICFECNKTICKTKYGTNLRARISNLLSSVKVRAKQKCHQFDLTLDFMESLYEQQKGLCAYTNMPLSMVSHSTEVITIDRVNPSLGYIQSNVVFATKRANNMKTDMTKQELMDMCKLIIQNNE